MANPVIVTDPPYNIGKRYGAYADNRKDEEYWRWIKGLLSLDCPVVAIMYPEALHRLSMELGRVPDRVVEWVYPSNTRRQHRSIGFYGISPDMARVRQPYRNPTDKRVKRLIAEGKGAKLYDWWEVNQVKNVTKKREGTSAHPCEMPVKVMDNVIGILPDGITVIDPFCGTGTTGVACALRGVEFIGIELNPEYAEISRNRIAEARKRGT